MIKFSRDVLNFALFPWQQWAVIHGGELLEDGRPRFRKILLMVARQNGKTTLPTVLALYWQFVVRVPLILGTSTKLDYAKEAWENSVKLANNAPDLEPYHARKWTRKTNGEQESWTLEGSRYKIGTADEEGGRSLTIHRLICDELRQHHDYSAWDAAVPAGNAVRDFQVWALSNAGSGLSVVLNDYRDDALTFIEEGRGDPRAGLFEWSSPDDADPLDVEALAQANPTVNRPGSNLDWDTLLGDARTAVERGGDKLAGFLTEYMCRSVPRDKPAIDPTAWRDCRAPGDLAGVRDRVALVFEVSHDGQHVTLAAAAVLEDGRVRVEALAAWKGPNATSDARRDFPELVARVKPRALGWLPNGPTAALAADLRARDGWPPAGVELVEIRSDAPAVCMGFAELVKARGIAQSGDPLIDQQISEAERRQTGDTWVFSRKGKPVDAAWAVAGATHLARTLPASIGKPRVLFVSDDDLDDFDDYGDAA